MTLGVTHKFHFYPDEVHGWDSQNLLDITSKISSFIEAYIEIE